MGVVLPGDTYKIKGAGVLRSAIADHLQLLDLQMLTNKRGWVFDDVHQQKLIALCCARTKARGSVCEYVLRPEIHSVESWSNRAPDARVVVDRQWLVNYSPSLVVPIIPSCPSKEILDTFMFHGALRSHASLKVKRVYADFETYRDRDKWHSDLKDGDWPVYKGESFDLWEPDSGTYYAWTNGEAIAEAAHQRRLRCNRSSPYFHLPPQWRAKPTTHPSNCARICFRNVTNRGNRRTLIAALVPPYTVTTETAPWVLWLNQDEREQEEAFLLGVMSSIPADWWARRFIEGHADQEAFDCLRVPDYSPSCDLVRRVVALAGRLACPDKRFSRWAKASWAWNTASSTLPRRTT